MPIRPIDANALKKDLSEFNYDMALRIVDIQPTIEAEPIIHCKDCVFWESKHVSCEGLARCRTGESGYRCRFGHDFCSRAQKRNEVE